MDGTFIHVPRSLVGVYKAYNINNKLYSRSGVTPTANNRFFDLTNAANARGAGYQLIDFQQHCVIAFMLYAKYGNRNLQAILGAGGVIYEQQNTTTGTTNYIGNSDTINENTSGKYVNGLGLEGVFGGINEWVQGVSISNNIWTITDHDGNIRNITTCNNSGWIKNIAAENGVYFDIVPTNIGGSETTCYSDYYDKGSGGTLSFMRSYYSAGPYGGVASAYCTSAHSSAFFGSRLAFRGKIVKALSISLFETLPIE